jgi:hypothetical protein
MKHTCTCELARLQGSGETQMAIDNLPAPCRLPAPVGRGHTDTLPARVGRGHADTLSACAGWARPH